MSESFRTGTEVLNRAGRRGVVTDEIRKSGINKGRVGVQWIGAPYAISEYPDDLTPVHKDLDKPVVAGDPDVRYIVASNVDREEALKRYLYGDSTLLQTSDCATSDRYVCLIVVHAIDRAAFSATYQAERLRSGLMGALVYTTYAQAVESFLSYNR
jgi:hypothetical protein